MTHLIEPEVYNEKVKERLSVAFAKYDARPALNAFTQTIRDISQSPLSTFDGALSGRIFSVKDNIDVEGWKTTAGTAALRSWRPARTATVVQRLIRAGATLFGKNNMHELAAGVTGENVTFGATRNPLGEQFISGGSSGGGAAAVAAGIVDFALGTDTAGSCRIPAALCGCVGFRPSLERYPLSGVLPLSRTRDVIGLFARSVAEISELDRICAGDIAVQPLLPALHGARIGVLEDYYFDGLESGVQTVIQAALEEIVCAGAELVPVEIPGLADIMSSISLPLIAYEAPREIAMYLADAESDATLSAVMEEVADPRIAAIFRAQVYESMISGEAYRLAIVRRHHLAQLFADCFAKYELDVLAAPTTRATACRIGAGNIVSINGDEVTAVEAYMRNTDPSACVGMPSISLPCGVVREGLPVGLMLESLPGSDIDLLGLACVIEGCLS